MGEYSALIKLLVVFVIIIGNMLILHKPMWIGGIAAAVATILLYRLDGATILNCLKSGIFGWTTIQMLLVFYFITFVQRMLEKRRCLVQAQQDLSALYNNRRINASVAPSIIGLLPAAGAVLMCGDIVREATDGYLSKEEQCFVTSFFRHVPEAFMPTYTSTLIAISMTEGRVKTGTFVLAMLPMVLMLYVLGNAFYLRKVPKDAGAKREKSVSYYYKDLLKNLWVLIFVIVLVLAFNIPVYWATLAGLIAFIFIGRFKWEELKPMIVSAFETKMMGTTVVIMVFKETLTASGVIGMLPDYFAKLPIPTYLVFALIFFFGTMVAGTQAIIVLCMPMAMATVTGSALPLFILCMTMTYVVMQLSPTHICLEICADDYGLSMGDYLKKAFPVIISFVPIVLAYYWVLDLIV